MSVIKDENYYFISGWMLNHLNLKGTALMVYAIIYGFSQDGQSEFTGSRKYLCDFTGATKPTIDKALNELCESGLIIKYSEIKNGVIFNRYRVNLNFATSKETLPPSKETLQGDGKETLPNNIDINKNNNNKEYIPFGEYGRVKLTHEQYDKLVSEHNKKYIDDVIQALDEYVQSNNNKQKYKDFNAVIRRAIREKWFNIDESPDNNVLRELDETDEEYEKRIKNGGFREL